MNDEERYLLKEEVKAELRAEARESRTKALKTTAWVVGIIVVLGFPFFAARVGTFVLWGWMIVKARRDAGRLGLVAGIIGGGFITIYLLVIIYQAKLQGTLFPDLSHL